MYSTVSSSKRAADGVGWRLGFAQLCLFLRDWFEHQVLVQGNGCRGGGAGSGRCSGHHLSHDTGNLSKHRQHIVLIEVDGSQHCDQGEEENRASRALLLPVSTLANGRTNRRRSQLKFDVPGSIICFSMSIFCRFLNLKAVFSYKHFLMKQSIKNYSRFLKIFDKKIVKKRVFL